jgi:16S rRNA pseudouridine516 synthase
MRLDKFISNHTSVSRSEVRRLLKAKAVTVNGDHVRDPALPVNPEDQVLLHGERIVPLGKHYYMLNKPAGYVCANLDSEHPTVLDLLRKSGMSARIAQDLQIAGRLDIDTTGLVLLTNDGQWNHRLTSPRSSCQKVYRVTLAEPYDAQSEALFAKGVQLKGEKRPTLPAQIEVLDAHQVLLTIQEGKYHQVKRMFAATGNRVVDLHRLSVGDVQLDPTLEPGQFRALTRKEIESVENAATGN